MDDSIIHFKLLTIEIKFDTLIMGLFLLLHNISDLFLYMFIVLES